MNYQHIVLIGRATHDAEAIVTQNDRSFTKFSIAVNQYRGKDLDAEVTFYDCLVMEKEARERALDVKKGNTVFIHGRPSVDAYINKAGEARPAITVFVSDWRHVETTKSDSDEREEKSKSTKSKK